MHDLYILYSESLDMYYVGESVDVNVRLKQHNSGFYKGSSTSRVSDWKIYLTSACEDRNHARRVELFIKRQKSRKFIESLKSDQMKLKDIVDRLK